MLTVGISLGRRIEGGLWLYWAAEASEIEQRQIANIDGLSCR